MSRLLTDAVLSRGLASRSASWEVLQPKVEHLVLAERSAGLVARVRPTSEVTPYNVFANLRLVAALARRGAPVVAPAWPKPILLEQGEVSHIATLWPLGNSRRVTFDEMAEVLRQIHDIPPPTEIRSWVKAAYGRVLADAQALRLVQPNPPSADSVDECIAMATLCLRSLSALLEDAPDVVVHGDAHPANIITLDGEVLACDLDRVSLGPPEADLAVALMHSRRYPGADPEAGEHLVSAYRRPLNRELLEACVAARDISKLVSLVRCWEEPQASDSFVQRLDAIRSGGRYTRLHGSERLCPFA